MHSKGYSFLITFLLVCVFGSDEEVRKRQGWQPHCPTTCICQFNTVYCDAMGLRQIPRPIPDNTEALYLRDNDIRKIQFKQLRGLSNVRHLLMKGNRLSEIQMHAFKHLIKLVSLSLTDNNLRYMYPKLFRNQANLQVLSLRNNRIKHIRGLFDSLPKLQLLNIANNQVRYIHHNLFKHNTLLRVLDMHNNQIKHIPSHTFSHLSNLRFLVLRDNPIKSIQFNFVNNLHLELLDLTNCKLKAVPEGLPNSVNDLRLAENQITELGESTFNTTKQIRLLVLNNNLIKKIHENSLANLDQLYDFYIGNNKLTHIPVGLPRNIHGIYANYNNISSISEGAFSYHSKLEFLFLRNNNLKELDQTALHGVHNLRSLDLSRNELKALKPYTFSKLRELELLDLSKNPLIYLDYGCFSGLYKLTILQLSSVAIKSLVMPSMFRDMNNLRFLDLSNSASLVKKMSENKMMFKSFKSVEDLNMMNDMLHNLPPEFAESFPELRYLKLIGNPWHCDESIIWLTDWMRNTSITFYAPHFMTCKSPSALRGKRLQSLRKGDIMKVNKHLNIKYDIKPGKLRPVDKHSLFYDKTQDNKQKWNNERRYLSKADVEFLSSNTSGDQNDTDDSVETYSSSEYGTGNNIRIKITPVKSVEDDVQRGELIDNAIPRIPDDEDDYYDNLYNQSYEEISREELEEGNINDNDENFNVISQIEDIVNGIDLEGDGKGERTVSQHLEWVTDAIKSDIFNHIDRSTEKTQRDRTKPPLDLFKYKYIQGKATEQERYNDRVFERPGDEEGALLQKYASAIKVKQSQALVNQHNSDNEHDLDSEEVGVQMVRPPVRDEGSGFPSDDH